MSGSITVTSGIVVNNGSLQYNSYPKGFTATQTNANGPSPGTVTVTTGGVTIDLSKLTTPAIVHFVNLDPTNFVSYGLYDSTTFRPFGELLPGESWVLRLSRTLLTANTAADVLRMVADTASVKVLVACFDA